MAGRAPGTAAPLGRDPPRGFRDDEPRARLGLRGRAGARRRRPHPRAARPRRLAAGRLDDERRGRLAVEPRAAAARRLRDPELRHRGRGGADQHRAGGRLSRRRPARGVLRHRAADGHRGAGAEARSGRAAPAQPDSRRPLSVQDHHRPGLRLRQLSRGAHPGAGRGRLSRPPARAGGPARARARSSASASRATWSPARWAGRAAASRSRSPDG